MNNNNRNNNNFKYFYFTLKKGLFNVYTIEHIKQKIDRPHGFVCNNVGIFISKRFSLSVQLVLS